jgi:hypothetical protein
LLGGQDAECACGHHDDINLERNQFRRKSGEPLDRSTFPSATRYLITSFATLDVTEVTQFLEDVQVRVAAELAPSKPIRATFPACWASAASGAARRPPVKARRNVRRSTTRRPLAGHVV